MTDTDSLTTREAKLQILAILKRIPTQNLPKFKDKDGCIWFSDLSMGFISASHPADLAARHIDQMLAAESASRELIRRGPLSSRAIAS